MSLFDRTSERRERTPEERERARAEREARRAEREGRAPAPVDPTIAPPPPEFDGAAEMNSDPTPPRQPALRVPHLHGDLDPLTRARKAELLALAGIIAGAAGLRLWALDTGQELGRLEWFDQPPCLVAATPAGVRTVHLGGPCPVLTWPFALLRGQQEGG